MIKKRPKYTTEQKEILLNNLIAETRKQKKDTKETAVQILRKIRY